MSVKGLYIKDGMFEECTLLSTRSRHNDWIGPRVGTR